MLINITSNYSNDNVDNIVNLFIKSTKKYFLVFEYF
jgi:hypothetical protein